MNIGVLGAGAFGTAMAVALARNGAVTLWARDAAHADDMRKTRSNARRLPGVTLPENVSVTAQISDVTASELLLLAMPMQQMAGFLAPHAFTLRNRMLVACSKGIDLGSGLGPAALIANAIPEATPALLTGPSFAADIARGLPTALTLACASDAAGEAMQARLSTPVLRVYRTTDMIGAELGGALKNVVAIAAGVVIGAGLGDSARAALMTRGFAEMNRFATARGARPDTLMGLSGLGDLVLTCTSAQSRNFRYGQALGANTEFDASTTVEGVATSKAVSKLAVAAGIDMPITSMVAALVEQKIAVDEAIISLLSRPLKQE
ncbi:MAG: glycerol-3-phosphate dehydrogenase [Alphaproteobacteria bacterium HGW-Alphaproteobacteria-4]|jgi:glycerol-3-phosphate dehydrogenase (NAD(P)+)|nr:MAG: glycerol-3-phosphate dehydrogenase [Alphaproteobacteria bacterium HGW-Alphaproteobacteria-4]